MGWQDLVWKIFYLQKDNTIVQASTFISWMVTVNYKKQLATKDKFSVCKLPYRVEHAVTALTCWTVEEDFSST